MRIDYVLNGRQHIYHPDALVIYRAASGRKPELCEIKPQKILREKWGEFRPRFKAAVHEAHSRGWIFKIYTERRIRTPRLENLRGFKFHLQQLANDEFRRLDSVTQFEVRKTRRFHLC